MENNVIPLDYLFYLRIQRKKYKEQSTTYSRK